jgi:hypothetical protein
MPPIAREPRRGELVVVKVALCLELHIHGVVGAELETRSHHCGEDFACAQADDGVSIQTAATRTIACAWLSNGQGYASAQAVVSGHKATAVVLLLQKCLFARIASTSPRR